MGQFDKKFRCNKFVQVIDQSQPGVFYLQNDEFQFYIHKNDEFHENAHFL